MTPTLQPIRQLIAQARQHPGAALPVETHQSYPIPVRDQGAPQVVFLYCVSRLVPRDGLYLMAPSYRATLDATSGKFEELRAVVPGELGTGPETGPSIGKYGMPEGMTSEQFLELQAKLYAEYDALLPLFFADAGSGRDFPKLAQQFRSRFFTLSEAPLHPFYRALGRAFFAWLSPGEP